MAVTSFSVAVINNRLKDRVNDQILKSNRFIQYAKKHGCFKWLQGGDAVEFYVRYQESGLGARAVSDFTEPQAETIDDYKALEMPWCRYARALASSKFQEKRAKNANAADTNWNYVALQMKSFLQQFMNVFGSDIYGTGARQTSRNDVGDPITGLGGWVDNDNTVAGENSATSTWWQAKVETEADFFGDDILSDEPNGLKTMRNAWNDASVGQQSGKGTNESFSDVREEPSLTICDQTSYEKYENSLHGRDRIMTDSPDASYKTLTFKRKPMDWDTFCTANTMYMPNLDHCEIHCTESSDQLIGTYGEDMTGIIKKIVMATQLCMLFTKRASSARVDITG